MLETASRLWKGADWKVCLGSCHSVSSACKTERQPDQFPVLSEGGGSRSLPRDGMQTMIFFFFFHPLSTGLWNCIGAIEPLEPLEPLAWKVEAASRSGSA